MRKAIVGILAAALLVASTSPVMAIVYGKKTGSEHGNVGSMVVRIGDDYFQACTGTLINEGVMLTAAHCVVGLDPAWGLYVTFEPDILDAIPDSLIEAEPLAHPRFGKSMSNLYDVGALVFDHPGWLRAEPARLAPLGYLSKMSKRDRRNATFEAVGYGTIRESRKKGRQGILDNTERRAGNQSFQSLQKAWLTLSMNQATGNAGTCYGDSGGPHFLDGMIVSLTVTGDTMCKATDKTYRVDRQWVYDWLNEHGLLQ